MKRNFIIRNVIITLVIIALMAGIFYYFIGRVNRSYEIEKVETYNYFVLKQGEKFGVLDKNGNIIVNSKYSDVKIPNPSKAVFVCYQEDTVEILNEKSEKILTQYEKVEPIRLKNIATNLAYEKSILKYEENGKYGLINYEGKKITKALYEEIEALSYKEGELVVKNNGKIGIINIKGNKMVDVEYDSIEVDGYYISGLGYKEAGYIVSNKTEEGYRFGYVNYKGKEILKPEYNEISRINNTEKEIAYLIVSKDGKFGLMKDGEVLIKNEYQSIEYDEANKILIIEKNKQYGIATTDGNVIVPTKYNQIDITGIYIYAENSQGITVYNSNGTEANIDKNMAILNTTNEKYKIRIDNKNGTHYGVIGQDGQQIIEEKYNYIEYLHDNYFIVSNEKSKLGVIDHKENIKIAMENAAIQKIEGSNMVHATNTTDKVIRLYSGNMQMLCELKNAKIEIKTDYVRVYNEEESKFYSKEGKELTSKEVYSQNTLLAKNENGKWGFQNRSGETVVEAQYEKVTEFNEYGFASVQKDGKWGAINSQGQEVVAPIYKFNEEEKPKFINKYYQVTYGYGEEYYTDNNI